MRTCITLPDSLFIELKDYCKQEDIKLSELIRKGIKKTLEGDENRK